PLHSKRNTYQLSPRRLVLRRYSLVSFPLFPRPDFLATLRPCAHPSSSPAARPASASPTVARRGQPADRQETAEFRNAGRGNRRSGMPAETRAPVLQLSGIRGGLRNVRLRPEHPHSAATPEWSPATRPGRHEFPARAPAPGCP